MNKEYVVTNDKVIVSNEKGNIKEISNSDKLDEILIQENIVEKIETEIDRFNELKRSINPNESHIREDILNGLIFIIIPLIVGGFFKLFGVTPYVYQTIYGGISAPILMSGVVGIASIIKLTMNAIKDYKKNKESKKVIKGANLGIKYLKKILPVEQMKLNTLKHEKTLINNDNDNKKIMKVEESPRIKEIENLRVVNYRIGKNFMKYYRNYLTGTLHFVLEKEDDLHNMDHYFDIIEEEGPKLVKNFRHTDMY